MPPVYFVQKFIDGLKDEVRRVVIVQRRQDMDAASSIALLQEEAIEGVKFGMVRKSEGGTYVKSLHKTNSQSQLTTTQHSHSNRDAWTTPVDDKKNGDPSRIREDRVSALRTYRRSKGLCFTCGEKWSKDHKCSTSVQLHVVQELVSLLQDEINSSEQVEVQDEKEDLIAMAISQHAASGTEAAHSIRLRGWIQETELLMLIDSGSTNSFIDEQVAMKLKGVEVLKQPLKVQIADGGQLLCSKIIPGCTWYMQGQSFKNDFKLIPLGSYDIILGMDWLEQHSPMQVDWVEKWIEFQYQNRAVRLQGISSSNPSCSLISVP